MTEKIVGHKAFGSKIDITDPCYEHNVWCRMNGVEIVPGNYECYVEMASDEETGGWGERVARIGIRHTSEDHGEFYDYLGDIGVDAGLAGFFENKPDYTDEEWLALCDSIVYLDYSIRDEGFFSSSGYGDGSYGVYASISDNGISALYIEFIELDDDDE